MKTRLLSDVICAAALVTFLVGLGVDDGMGGGMGGVTSPTTAPEERIACYGEHVMKKCKIKKFNE